MIFFFFFQAEDGIRDYKVTGVRRVLFRSRRAGRRNEPEPVVQQRDEDAELGDPEQPDREQIAPVEPRARPPSPPPDWLTMSRERPYDILRARRNAARACPPAIIKERSLPQRMKRAPTPTYFSMVGWS